MKITRFRIENYRGIRDAYAENLEQFPFIVFTGRNGTGKSLILEALTAVWANEINLPDLVGPYANSLSVEIAVKLSNNEYRLLEDWLEETGQPPAERKQEHVLQAVATSTQESGQYLQHDSTLEALQNRYFANRYSFANLDLLSARRQPSLSAEIGVDLNLLDSVENALQRRQMIQDEIRWKNAQYMPDVGSYLTALDYREYVSRRENGEDYGEYARLQKAFYRATGKTISRPSFDPHTGRPDISVEIPSGIKHALADLSNGEREMIGMFYYISQLASRGGVLLLDEPEKHLHPTLQTAVLEAITSVAGQGQALIVTHSPTIVATLPQDQIYSVRGAWETTENQVRWASASQEDFEPLSEIGIRARDLLQMEALLVVEGPDDATRLKMLFPEELARVKVIEAGGRERVLQAAEALDKAKIGIPHLSVVDRDFLTSDEVEQLEGKGVFVWRGRMLENIMLHPPLVAAATFRPENDVLEVIRSCAADLRADAVSTFAEQRVLKHTVKLPANYTRDTEGHIQSQIDIWQARLQKSKDIETKTREEIESDWNANWHLYVDGKKLLGAVHSRLSTHRNKQTFAEFLLNTARTRPEVMPSECSRFLVVLNGIAGQSEEDISYVNKGSSTLDQRVREGILRRDPEPGLNMTEADYVGGPGC